MRKMFLLPILFTLLAVTLWAEIAETPFFARLSFVTGNAYIQRAVELSYEEAEVNMPVAEGDRLGTIEGRAEVHLGRGNYLRLDENTKIDIVSLPKTEEDAIQIRIWSGNVFLSLKTVTQEKNIAAHTPDASLYVLDSGLYRLDVRDTESEVFVFDGLIEAAGSTESILIKKAQRLEAIQGHFTSRPTRFLAAAEDSFDRWNEHRDAQVHKHLAQKYLPEEIQDFEYELASHGDWIRFPPYDHVWIPRDISPGWRPYSNGRWVWMPSAGWTWLPHEPWGWVTFHYGRWHWHKGLGWYWIPASVWGPAWVSWYWSPDYCGWAPLTIYDSPGVLLDGVYFIRYDRPDYPVRSSALTVVHRKQLQARNILEVALGAESLMGLDKIQMTKRSPTLSPSSRAEEKESGGQQAHAVEKRQVWRLRGTRSAEVPDIRKPDSVERDKIQRRNIRKSPLGYPSSSAISLKRPPRRIRPREPSSILGRIYDSLSGKTGKAISGRSRKAEGASVRRIRLPSKTTKPPSKGLAAKSSAKAKKKK